MPVGVAFQHRYDRVLMNGFDQMIVEPGLSRSLPVFGLPISGNSHDGLVRESLVAQCFCDLEAVHTGKTKIEKNRLWLKCSRDFKGRRSVVSRFHFLTQRL